MTLLLVGLVFFLEWSLGLYGSASASPPHSNKAAVTTAYYEAQQQIASNPAVEIVAPEEQDEGDEGVWEDDILKQIDAPLKFEEFDDDFVYETLEADKEEEGST